MRNTLVWSLMHLQDNKVIYGTKRTMDYIASICATMPAPIRIESRTDGLEKEIFAIAGMAKAQGYWVSLETNIGHPYAYMNEMWAMVRYRNKNIIYGPVDIVNRAVDSQRYGSQDTIVKRIDIRRFVVEDGIHNNESYYRRYNPICLAPNDDNWDYEMVQEMISEEIQELNSL